VGYSRTPWYSDRLQMVAEFINLLEGGDSTSLCTHTDVLPEYGALSPPRELRIAESDFEIAEKCVVPLNQESLSTSPIDMYMYRDLKQCSHQCTKRTAAGRRSSAQAETPGVSYRT